MKSKFSNGPYKNLNEILLVVAGTYLACPTAVVNAMSIPPGNQPEIDDGNEICFKHFSELIHDEVSTERTQ